MIHMSEVRPRTRAADMIDNQILRSATGMAANYRAAGRSRSKAEFIARLGVVIEEADEKVFWLELLRDSGILKPTKLESTLDEANQLVAIFAAIEKDENMRTKVKSETERCLTRSRVMTAITGDDGDFQ